VGSFNVNKNQEFTLKVFKNIILYYPNAKLHLVGNTNNEYSLQIKRYIEEHNLENNVFLYPPHQDVYSVVNKSNIFIMPSLREGFGIVLIEAQAIGVNCYVSDTIPNSTNVGGCTYLSLENGPEYWAKIIIEDFKKGKIVRQKYDTENFTTKMVSEKYKQIYGGS
jgi:glycosyltransferase involved in cell wall biosynthesis